jgi:hypothetical protein
MKQCIHSFIHLEPAAPAVIRPARKLSCMQESFRLCMNESVNECMLSGGTFGSSVQILLPRLWRTERSRGNPPVAGSPRLVRRMTLPRYGSRCSSFLFPYCSVV